MMEVGNRVEVLKGCGMGACPFVGSVGTVKEIQNDFAAVDMGVPDCSGKLSPCWISTADLRLHVETASQEEEKPVVISRPSPSVVAKFVASTFTSSIQSGIAAFRKAHDLTGIPENIVSRVPDMATKITYQGAEGLNFAATALLGGMNLLLEGPKGAGKNTLAETLGWVLNRPVIECPLNVYADEEKMVGAMTFKKGEVTFQPGPVVNAMRYGALLVLDEINMARPEAIAVLNGILDGRRRIDIPGVGRIDAHKAFRVIGTMNHGYIGTQDLNEALADRFVIMDVQAMNTDDTADFLCKLYPKLKTEWAGQIAALHHDLEEKAEKGEMSSRGVSFRGLLDALNLMQLGVWPYAAFVNTLAHKTFDPTERQDIMDVITTRFSPTLDVAEVFR